MKYRKVVSMALILAMSVALVSCANNNGQKKLDSDNSEVESLEENDTQSLQQDVTSGQSEEELEDNFSNFLEERIGEYEFESYEQIISLLEPGEAYGYAKIYGLDEDVLFITDGTFLDDGASVAMEAYPYIKKQSGKYVCGQAFITNSTATPISITEEGYILEATHNTLHTWVYDSSTDGIIIAEYVYAEWGTDESSNTYGGFIRDISSAYGEEKEIPEDGKEEFEKAFAYFDTAKPISFTVVGEDPDSQM